METTAVARIDAVSKRVIKNEIPKKDEPVDS
jgi:hypothetical protein